MDTSSLCFWIGTVSLGLAVTRSFRIWLDPESYRQRVFKAFELREWRFWLGAAHGIVTGLALLTGYWYANFRWLWLLLGISYLLVVTGVSMLIFFTSFFCKHEDYRERVNKLYQPDKIAKHKAEKALAGLLQSTLVFLLWLIAWRGSFG